MAWGEGGRGRSAETLGFNVFEGLKPFGSFEVVETCTVGSFRKKGECVLLGCFSKLFDWLIGLRKKTTVICS